MLTEITRSHICFEKTEIQSGSSPYLSFFAENFSDRVDNCEEVGSGPLRR